MRNVGEELKPYELSRSVFFPGHAVYGFYIGVSSEALFRPGVLVKIANVFSSRGIPIVCLKIPRTEEYRPINMLIFVDLTDKEEDADVLVAQLSKLKFITCVELIRPISDGFVAYDGFLPLTVFGERAIILRKPLYAAFVKNLYEKLGWGARAFLYYVGLEMGRNAYRDLKRLFGGDRVRLLKIAEALFIQAGFGILKIVDIDFDEMKAVIRIYHSFECELYKRSDKATSHLIRGTIAGWLSELFQRDVFIEEVKCIAKGDPYCEFKARKKEDEEE